VLSLKHLRTHDPALLGAILRDGRPVVDRDGIWSALVGARHSVERATAKARVERHSVERVAAKARVERHRRATQAVAQLIGA
jgi:hypothetical protein